MCFLRYAKIWMSSSRCPSLGIARCEDNIKASILMYTLPNSTIHLNTPMSEFQAQVRCQSRGNNHCSSGLVLLQPKLFPGSWGTQPHYWLLTPHTVLCQMPNTFDHFQVQLLESFLKDISREDQLIIPWDQSTFWSHFVTWVLLDNQYQDNHQYKVAHICNTMWLHISWLIFASRHLDQTVRTWIQRRSWKFASDVRSLYLQPCRYLELL